MAYTILPSAAPRNVAFDEHQFARRRSKHANFDYTEFTKVSFKRFKCRRDNPVPEFANSNAGLQEALCKYLEARFHIKPSDDIATRLERCRAAARKTAEPTKALLERGIKTYRALVDEEFHELPFKTYQKVFLNRLRGESDEKLIERHGQQVAVWDSEYFNTLRAPELALSVAYQSLRLGYDSPTVAENLAMRAPAVRQLLSRFIKRAVRKTNTQHGRPKKKA
jgi:hypothetical protein